MNNDERDRIISKLDETFLYLGASDFDFADKFSYPLDAVSKGRADWVSAFNHSPKQSGLKDMWGAQAAWVSEDGFRSMRAEDVHWSAVSRLFQSVSKMGRSIGYDYAETVEYSEFTKFEFLRIDPYGKKKYYKRLVFAWKGNRYFCLNGDDGIKDCSEYSGKWLLEANEILIGMAAVEPTYWLANVKVQPNVPGLSLITDPTGIKELWKFRDAPAGKRRGGLLNWVSDHWRRDRHDPDVEVYVRKHLRGNRHLTFKDFSVTLKESAVDTVAELELRRTRDAMRKADPRLDRRKRQRELEKKGVL
jgi:hypothetical protein